MAQYKAAMARLTRQDPPPTTKPTSQQSEEGATPASARGTPLLETWGDESELLRKARRQAGASRRLIVTFAAPTTLFALNQLAWFERAGLRHWLLVCMDAHTHTKLCHAAPDSCVLAPPIHFADGGPLKREFASTDFETRSGPGLAGGHTCVRQA